MLNRRALLIALTAVLAGTSACTVQPLYADRSNGGYVNNVAIADVKTRVSQQVRNRLLFLLNGSGAEATNPEFEAALSVTSNAQGVLKVSSVETDDGSDISARRVKVSGTLTVLDIQTRETLVTYKRNKYASFDNSTQAFANSRALIDAENRAAAELAEEFRNLIVSFTARR